MPDFIIGGAMKCATTTLHEILATHPRVYMPPGERKFFDVDDIDVHPDFFGRVDGGWTLPNFDSQQDVLLPWYQSHFTEALPDQLIGEDSPSYLCSEKAPARIARLLPDVRLIFLLRDPVARAYSNYWHWVRTGRAFFDFEDTLRHNPTTIIRKGCYKQQLERYFEVFPRSQVQVLIFEEFIADPARIVAEVESFLGLPHAIGPEALAMHRNPSRLPRFPRLQLLVNRWNRSEIGRSHLARLPVASTPAPRSVVRRALLRLHALVNPLRERKPPAMNPLTRQFLAELYAAENSGLSALLGLDLRRYWKDCVRD